MLSSRSAFFEGAGRNYSDLGSTWSRRRRNTSSCASRCSSTVSGKIFFSIGAAISSTVVKALSIITASKNASHKYLWISVIVLGNCHKIIFAWRLNDCLQSTRHLFKLGQSLIPASLDTLQSFAKFLSGHGTILSHVRSRSFLWPGYPRRLRINPGSESVPLHTPPSAEVAGYAGFALFEALSDLLIIKDVLTRNEVDELLARTASRLQTSPNEVSRRTADFIRQLGEQ
jgi:hypothetical protein